MSFYGRSSNPLRKADFLSRTIADLESRHARVGDPRRRPDMPGHRLAALAASDGLDTAGGAPLSVSGDLDLLFCPRLVSLPDDLEVEGNLNLGSCHQLVRLPSRLVVGGHLKIRHCATLFSLGAHLRVGGDLQVVRCPSLFSLPGDLEIGGRLEIVQCHGLSAVPFRPGAARPS